ncbi:hypothetical protein [Malaciobacter mytili]|uniref:HTH cro/C1-type domain-containing protein n=1 Tax=Malaciobacter mytili LMG 24559 TaxID=1032238 RepID=A0AAX2AEZ2_9BACT|nr:hypothetical protein [Malaciobacter mytili]AXH13844.1 hypothetical protein AMYT_0225 [Malaciobacter mytili LMG 24559]RXI40672.1 hypothetical protein CRU99_10200 [Malaciobacter mytili]RXK15503.1 hypothetical protein CP985_08195 [Malaciobacter mytili LMG 24559]
MEKIDIPQEENKILEGHRKVMYVSDEKGEFHTENYGSSVEEFATKTAVEEFDLLAKESLKKIQLNEASPIEYYMYKNRMDFPTLVSVVGMFSFRVKRHLKMKNFKKLSDKILNRYCEAFNISLEELKGFKV